MGLFEWAMLAAGVGLLVGAIYLWLRGNSPKEVPVVKEPVKKVRKPRKKTK